MTYEQAYEDHSYLWKTYGPARDMTGGYVDQDDLSFLLSSPSKDTARRCLSDQINYWFQVGPEGKINPDIFIDSMVFEIAERHNCDVYDLKYV